MVSFPYRKMIVQRCCIALSALLALALFETSSVQATQTDAPLAERLEIEFEQLHEVPYEQEMLLLTIRGFYPYLITLNEL